MEIVAELEGISAVVVKEVEAIAAGVGFESSDSVGGSAGSDLSGDEIKSVGMTISFGSDGGTAFGSRDLTRSL